MQPKLSLASICRIDVFAWQNMAAKDFKYGCFFFPAIDFSARFKTSANPIGQS